MSEGKGLMSKVDDAVKGVVGEHYMIAAGLILVLLLLVLYFALSSSESFMPSSTLRYQKLDGLGFENMEGGAAGGPKEGSAAWKVLNSEALGCDKRDAPNDDAWSWMSKQAGSAETAVGGRRPTSDDDLSKIAAGRR